MVVLLSGDGGWLDFNDSLAVSFTKAGYDVIGFNSRSYFWHRKTPEQTAADFTRLLTRYMKLWNNRRITLNGYSFGADVVPFIYNRLPDELKARVTEIQLLSPFLSTDFEVYLTDLINLGGDDRDYKVKEELSKIKVPIYCFYGQDEDHKPLADVSAKNFHLSILPGGHHYTGGYGRIITSAGRSILPFNLRNPRQRLKE
ncbi:AcvB/VirJ family lysyl-phosphatidylglycerol hydrolase [Arcticibacter sp. MXS-1]|uniref:AcvB/VirJ family lysyl-phosphatidylglycerol hydrolase n=1 Tax=Arcticibacter sp. MXS-1 TaxID=3341726 RepID=UPI0035A9A007